MRRTWKLLSEAGEHFTGEWRRWEVPGGDRFAFQVGGALPPGSHGAVRHLVRGCLKPCGYKAFDFKFYPNRLEFTVVPLPPGQDARPAP